MSAAGNWVLVARCRLACLLGCILSFATFRSLVWWVRSGVSVGPCASVKANTAVVKEKGMAEQSSNT